MKYPPFQVKVESYKNIEDFGDYLEDIKYIFEKEIDETKLKLALDAIFNENLKNVMEEINLPLIITEGKTDWKHIIKALEFFNLKNEFLSINKDLFLRYGDKEDIENKICETNHKLEFNNSKLKGFLETIDRNRTIDPTSASVSLVPR